MTKYIIRRTSGWYDEKPCDGAVLEELDCFDVRTCSRESLLERNIISKDDLENYENFINTKYNNETWCKKPLKAKYYTIDIDNLEDFCNNIGEKIIIFPKNYAIEMPLQEIEIYDDWRE